ncbi:hypothetical protein MCOR27_009306 [Pyricularia oryzae]|uniref:Uncharacterized protein n=1 Tax=Pyricularia oryzae TaxID=318829 RepID=A0A4P7NC33_PYROR|nr:hypothetical protein MCOR01_000103 [Pyricularia oryzae]KAH9428193.1 hypothetical protein MCOR02_011681 [Pyricularia oryzae]KAI6263002.1 hypothetical protein MCOR19_000815 [Pyricularia oryzae]KAI6270412.1 hypothetical protein MCOR27_009306 [Pyricularia oryzae]KAI6319163.1 hypothetical protein MCOR34_003348 [Pyricularia oryzae]
MLYKLAAVVLASGFVSTASAAFNFYCPGVNATGFYPSCCRGITGQVGVDCFSAHLIGGLPNFECNIGPPNNQRGCCQSINYTNPNTGYRLSLCTDTTAYPPV